MITVELTDAEAAALYTFAAYGEAEYADADPGGMQMNRQSFRAGGRGLDKLGAALSEGERVTPAHVTEIEEELRSSKFRGPVKTTSVAKWDLPPSAGPDESMGL